MGYQDDQIRMRTRTPISVSVAPVELQLLNVEEMVSSMAAEESNVSLSCMPLNTNALMILREKLSGSLSLDSLRLSGTHIDTAGAGIVAALVESALCLRVLDLRMNKIGDPRDGPLSDVQDFFEVLGKSKSLEVVKLSGNVLEDACCGFVGQLLLDCPNLSELDISENGITHHGIRLLAPALSKTSKLRKLDMQKNELGDIGAVEVCHALVQGQSKIRSLNLSWVGLSSVGTAGVLRAVQSSQTLRELRIKGAQACLPEHLHHQYCVFGKAFEQSVPQNSHLTTLDMEDCHLRDHCLHGVTQGVVANTTLRFLQLTGMVPIQELRTRYFLKLSGRRYGLPEALIISALLKTYGRVYELDLCDNCDMGLGVATLVSSAMLTRCRLVLTGMYTSRLDANLAVSSYYAGLSRCSWPRFARIAGWFLLLVVLFPFFSLLQFPWLVTQLVLSGKHRTQRFFTTRALSDHFVMRHGLPLTLLLSGYWWIPVFLVDSVASPTDSATAMWYSGVGVVLLCLLPLLGIAVYRLHAGGALYNVKSSGQYVFTVWSAGNVLVVMTMLLHFVQITALLVAPSALEQNTLDIGGSDVMEFARGLHWSLLTASDDVVPFAALVPVVCLCCFVLVLLQDILMRVSYSRLTKLPYWRKYIYLFTETLFVFVVYALCAWLACEWDSSVSALVLSRDASVVCWEGEHSEKATFAAIALGFYVVGSTVLPALALDAYAHKVEFNFAEAFHAASRTFRAVLVCLTVFVQDAPLRAGLHVASCVIWAIYLWRARWISNVRVLQVATYFTAFCYVLTAAAMLLIMGLRGADDAMDEVVEFALLVGVIASVLVVWAVYCVWHRRALALHPPWDPLSVSRSLVPSIPERGSGADRFRSSLSIGDVSFTTPAEFRSERKTAEELEEEEEKFASAIELEDINLQAPTHQSLLRQTDANTFVFPRTTWTVHAVNEGYAFDPKLLARSDSDAAAEIKKRMARSKSSYAV